MGDVIVLEMWLWMYYFLVHENVSIENSTQYGRLKNNGKPLKPKTEKKINYTSFPADFESLKTMSYLDNLFR